ncbi:hypothetical protein B0H10DRAFT_2380551 [Mycena sp. CBHHK59/15]|nr:hypothetical protein B0H10DRAFT_2380551 [Mycena sp. CBHHK59/15]
MLSLSCEHGRRALEAQWDSQVGQRDVLWTWVPWRGGLRPKRSGVRMSAQDGAHSAPRESGAYAGACKSTPCSFTLRWAAAEGRHGGVLPKSPAHPSAVRIESARQAAAREKSPSRWRSERVGHARERTSANAHGGRRGERRSASLHHSRVFVGTRRESSWPGVLTKNELDEIEIHGPAYYLVVARFSSVQVQGLSL